MAEKAAFPDILYIGGISDAALLNSYQFVIKF